MSRRVDVDEALPAAELPPDVLHELYAHAREARPDECCGLVLGGGARRFRRVVRCRNEMTRLHHEDPQEHPLDARKAFWMNQADYHAAQRTAESEGERITAVYHSHVDAGQGAGVYLSELDLAYAEHALFPFPDAAQLVIAVVEDRVAGAGLFERDAPGAPFRGRWVVSAER